MQSSWQINIYSAHMACIRISGDCQSYQMLIPDERPYKLSKVRHQGQWHMSVPYSGNSTKSAASSQVLVS
ncbi:hypothetical protein [Echinimonas agarilytica]|uniref:Uncharacterized protein n=1 Tax=Echinimonas agarilytica TaxID=1215918 RepID=A0AA41W952_9GAMM|nr:hypothetical protein [Echinimonas agarilytica]MCM2681001.1 hypothetical protein [Echinimonas agarilytica]